ncbi:uncharacterized protein [Diadema antillarum]|uniref:uncharacterized protein n=1 Tax=Diadema antillarum TaxID=105358 RepID=UPI003A84AC21
MAVSPWNHFKEDRLVEWWNEHDYLYDNSHKQYTDRMAKETAVTEIAAELKVTPAHIRKRMLSLRTQYGKIARAHLNGSKTKMTGRQTWLLESLSFLSPHMKTRPYVYESVDPSLQLTDGEVFEVLNEGEAKQEAAAEGRTEEDQQGGEDKTLEIKRRKKKRRLVPEYEPKNHAPPAVVRQPAEEKSDEDGLFCLYLASEMRKITNPKIKVILRTKLQSEVTNAILQCMEEASGNQ